MRGAPKVASGLRPRNGDDATSLAVVTVTTNNRRWCGEVKRKERERKRKKGKKGRKKKKERMGEERRGGRVAELGMCWKLGGVWERGRREGEK